MRLLFWKAKPVPVLELHGTLSSKPDTLNLAAYGELIDRAMAAAAGKTLVLDIESPGGSPVQSELIASRIRERAAEKKVRVVAVIGEVGASGGYWLACAGDEIVANAMSIVGSIGVVGGGFGFSAALGRFGVQRRLYTAGENKARLDPFSPERPQDVAFVRGLMAELHDRFKAWVRLRRSGKLPADESAVFDGGWMLGARAATLGLVDRLGDLDAVVRQIGGDKAKSLVFKPKKPGLLARLPRIMAEALVEALQTSTTPRF